MCICAWEGTDTVRPGCIITECVYICMYVCLRVHATASQSCFFPAPMTQTDPYKAHGNVKVISVLTIDLPPKCRAELVKRSARSDDCRPASPLYTPPPPPTTHTHTPPPPPPPPPQALNTEWDCNYPPASQACFVLSRCTHPSSEFKRVG